MAALAHAHTEAKQSVEQEEASSPSTQHPALAHAAENGASASSLLAEEDSEQTEALAADAGIAAVVERTLQQAVVSKSLAAGKSGMLGTLGTSDSLEAHEPASPEAGSKAGALGTSDSSAPDALSDADKAEGSSASQHVSIARLGADEDAIPGSASAAEASDATQLSEVQHQSSNGRQHSVADHADDSGRADAKPGSTQDLLDTGQASTDEIQGSQAGSAEGTQTRAPEPELAPAQPSSASGGDPAKPVQATRRKSQAFSCALEREHLEGELDSLEEKEQEEV